MTSFSRRAWPLLISFFLLLIGPATADNAFSDSELDTLVGPIALYPDPLLTNVIRASTFPDQVKAAASGANVSDSWDASVKAVDEYPDVLKLMSSNQEWMNSLGWAAANQLQDVMDAVQRFRYRAQVAGNLQSDSKQTVIQEGTTIRIEPADPQVIYVPTYPPEEVDDHDFMSAFVYGTAIATSTYLWANVFNWNTCAFYAAPYGWRPPAAYYRPYGANNLGIYDHNNVTRLSGNNVVRGGVTINNNSVNVDRSKRNYVNNSSRNTAVKTNERVENNRTRNVQRQEINRTRVAPEVRTSISNRPAYEPSNHPRAVAPSITSYSSAGATSRESFRGARSRSTTSFSSGTRFEGGGRGGMRMRGGRRR